MMPRSVLVEAGVKRIVGGGSALTRNPLLLQEIKNVYQLPVVLDSRGDAAFGACLAGINTLEEWETDGLFKKYSKYNCERFK